MKITLIGSGKMGSGLAKQFSLAGRNIYFGLGAGQGTSIAPAWIRRAA